MRARTFRLLMLLLPSGFRQEYGLHMERSFRDQLRFAGDTSAAAAVWSLAFRDITATALRLRRDRMKRQPNPVLPPPLPGSEKNRMDNLLQDIRYATRLLLRSPGGTVVAIITLALGIGANTLMFSLVNGVLLKPFPLTDPHQLVHLWESNPSRGWPRFSVAPLNYSDWKEQGQSFQSMTALYGSTLTLTSEGDPVRLSGATVHADYFQTLGIEPLLGRAFAADEHTGGSGQVAVIGHDLWMTTFGGADDIIGRKITLNALPHEIIGVLPQGVREPSTAQLWVPMDLADEAPNRGAHYVRVIARLRPDVSLEQATAEIAAIHSRFPPAERGWTALAASFHEDKVSYARSSLYMLSGAVALVLLVACANVANLLLVRAAARRRELSLRTAIGATRGRLVRQLLVESLLLSFGGGVAGLVVALSGLRLVRSFGSDWLPRTDSLAIDPAVLGFTFAASLVTGLVFGLLPALQSSRSNPSESLREAGAATTFGGRQARLRSLLVVVEVAIAVVVVVGAGLLLRSLWRLQAVDPGFETQSRVAANVSLPRADYPEPENRIAFYDRLVERAAQIPGVRAVGATSGLPMGGDFSISFDVIGRPEPDQNLSSELRMVDPGYFEVMGIPLLAGRGFTAADDASSTDVVVVNERFVATFFPDEDPIGQQLDIGYGRTDGERPRTLIGVVADIRAFGLARDTPPTYYVSRRQDPMRAMSLVVHADGDPAAIVASVRSALAEIDPNLAVYNVQTLEQLVADSTASHRFRLGLIGAFAAVALVLASVGIYGMMSYSVASQTRDIGIRLALGAAPGDVRRHVLRQGLTLASIGLVLGVLGGLGFGRVLQGALYEIPAHDPATLAGVAAFLLLVATAACYLPARRATRVDPVVALRSE